MRTTPEENRACSPAGSPPSSTDPKPVRCLDPGKGLSAIDAPGQPFHDPEADIAFFTSLSRRFD